MAGVERSDTTGVAGCYTITGKFTASNIFVERLWRSVKYEEVYPNAYDTPDDAYRVLHQYFNFYNDQRFHQALGYRTPAEVYAGRSSILSPIGAENLP